MTKIGDWDPFAERPALTSARVDGIDLKPGDRVRLWPANRADILDMALYGKTARIESIEQDFEDRIYLAVTIDDDPGKDLGALRQPGHRFFFRPEDVEPLNEDGSTAL